MQDLSTLEGKNIHELREIARVLGIVPSTMKKGELISRIVAATSADAEDKPAESEAPARRGRRPRVSGIKVGANTPSPQIVSTNKDAEQKVTDALVAVESKSNEGSEPVAVEQKLSKRRGRRPKSAVAEQTIEPMSVAEEVTEVAESIGFRDYNHFGRLFRKRYGCTPYDVKSGRVTAEEAVKNSGNV